MHEANSCRACREDGVRRHEDLGTATHCGSINRRRDQLREPTQLVEDLAHVHRHGLCQDRIHEMVANSGQIAA
jgi:hypothetical protein